MKILLIRTSSLGDILQTFPVLEYLRATFPDAQIDWVVEKRMSGLVSPFVNRTLEVDPSTWLKKGHYQKMGSFIQTLRLTSYDVAFDLQGNIKSGLILAFCRAIDKVGFSWGSCREKLATFAANQRVDVSESMPIRLKYLTLVKSYFEDTREFSPSGLVFPLSGEEQNVARHFPLPSGPRVMIALCSRWKNKQLKETVIIEFLQKLQRWKPFTFYFVFGEEKEKKQVEKIASHFSSHSHVLGSLSFPAWQALMKEMDGVVSVDSAALHLSAMSNVPSFSLFGPTQGTIFSPDSRGMVQGVCPYGKHFVKQCPKLRTCPTGACMDFSSDALFLAFQEWFQAQCAFR